jgi:hypothetical protein
MGYTIQVARERFSLWAACRAAQAGSATAKRREFITALRNCGVLEYLQDPVNHEATLEEYDVQFNRWVVGVQQYLRTHYQKAVMYGVAAKLVSTYLKSAFVLGGFEATPLAGHIIPPIDSYLLLGLMVKRDAKFGPEVRWREFSQQDYQRVVGVLRELSAGTPAWCLEECWRP